MSLIPVVTLESVYGQAGVQQSLDGAAPTRGVTMLDEMIYKQYYVNLCY